MGDRFELFNLKCPYCGTKQESVYYAKSSGATNHRCEKCKKVSEISMGFELRKKTIKK